MVMSTCTNQEEKMISVIWNQFETKMVHRWVINNSHSQESSWPKLGEINILFLIIYFIDGDEDYNEVAYILKNPKWDSWKYQVMNPTIIKGTLNVKILHYMHQMKFYLGVLCERTFFSYLIIINFLLYTYLSHLKFN
jgi:hypothetical protein